MFKFTHGTHCVRAIIAQQLLVATSPVYYETQQQVLDDQLSAVTKTLSERVNGIVKLKQEQQDKINKAACDAMGWCESRPSKHAHRYNYWCNTMEYDSSTAICTMTRNHWHRGCFGGACDWNHDVKDEKHSWQLPMVSRDSMLSADGGSVSGAVTELEDIQNTETGSFGGKTHEDFH